ncbi:hypothetical protein AB6O49_28580 [Streptomyces sp. SBR177]
MEHQERGRRRDRQHDHQQHRLQQESGDEPQAGAGRQPQPLGHAGGEQALLRQGPQDGGQDGEGGPHPPGVDVQAAAVRVRQRDGRAAEVDGIPRALRPEGGRHVVPEVDGLVDVGEEGQETDAEQDGQRPLEERRRPLGVAGPDAGEGRRLPLSDGTLRAHQQGQRHQPYDQGADQEDEPGHPEGRLCLRGLEHVSPTDGSATRWSIGDARVVIPSSPGSPAG